MTRRLDLTSKIALEEERCAALGKALEQAASRLAALREELVSLPPESEIVVPVSVATSSSYSSSLISNTAKMSLFRMLFRGREDVFPRRWENTQKNVSGYSPACANEWKRGLCDKKKVKCSKCENRVFLPVSDHAITEHFKGHHTIGVYPMLPDETCCFLAVDFDKSSWQEDALAFVETARAFGIHPALERSRSGKGAHVWFFFATPIPAKTARCMGSFLITETMARCGLLSMESYDRLFPSQDTMPKGGFGNLIALPFQDNPRRQGNTLFVDDAFAPWPDQWAYLASVPLIASDFVLSLVQSASHTGHEIGACEVNSLDEHAAQPWMRPPSGQQKEPLIEGPLPEALRAVLAQSLYIEKAGVPSALLNHIQRLAAFQNPEFYKKQRMRLSTRGEPRVISCFEDLPEHLAIPRGCLPALENLLQVYSVALHLEDKRDLGQTLDVRFNGDLTPIQQSAADALLAHDNGIFVGPPGIGKTVLGTYLIAERRRNTLVLVHRQQLLDQWTSQLAMFLGIEDKEIGQLGGGKKKLTGKLDVAMMQSLIRKDAVDGRVAEYGHIIVDECHHLSAFSYERILKQAKAAYVVGLTATLERQDGRHPIVTMQLGPVRFKVDAKSEGAQRPFKHTLIVRDTGVTPQGLSETYSIQDVYTALVADARRNDLIFDDVVRALEEKRSPILLTERREHLDHFADRLKPFTRHLVVLRGGMKPSLRKEVFERLAAIPGDEERLLLATGKYIGEGFDDARLDTLFLALPISWKGTLTQYTGRLHRLRPGKTEVRIYDYVDSSISMTMSMFKKRLRGYRALGYARDESPLGIAPPAEEPTVEWDEAAFGDLEETP
jgi:superfamily II DNA or RNA helicase